MAMRFTALAIAVVRKSTVTVVYKLIASHNLPHFVDDLLRYLFAIVLTSQSFRLDDLHEEGSDSLLELSMIICVVRRIISICEPCRFRVGNLGKLASS